MKVDGAPLLVDNLALTLGGFEILKAVSLNIPKGALTGLIGPNGSGKTTLFNIVTGFINPTQGKVFLGSHDLAGLDVHQRSRLGLVRTFQTPRVFDDLSTRENVMVGFVKQTHSGFLQDMVRWRSAQDQHRLMAIEADRTLEQFSITHLANKQARDLTGGQRRMLEIARANVGRPRVLLLDEPSSGLNVSEIDDLRRWIELLNSQGMTIFLVSHDMELMNIVQHAYVLNFGSIIAAGTIGDVKRDPDVRAAYLGI